MSRTEIAPSKSLEGLSKGGVEFESIYDKLVAMANNLWWSWHPEVVELYRDLDPIRWRQLDHNPIALLGEFTPERLEAARQRAGAAQPHQSGFSPAEGISGHPERLGR